MSATDNINYPAPKQEYKVLVRCFTFNQSKYIEDTLNGFAIQQTNFPFVCFVMDDASTDGEQEVIKRWMERECDISKADTIDIPTSLVIIVPHRTNKTCTFAFYLLKQNLFKAYDKKIFHVAPWREKSEYEALCEGDDYWIDPLKLQKQVDFLDEHPKYGLVHTRIQNHLMSSNQIIADKRKFIIQDYALEDLIKGKSYIATLTVCFRRELLSLIDNSYLNKNFKMGDYPLWIELSRFCKFHYIDDSISVYRVLDNSASHSTDLYKKIAFTLNVWEIRNYFVHKYALNNLEKETQRGYFYNKSLLYAAQREYIKALKYWYYSYNFIGLIYLIKIILNSFKTR